MKRMISLWISSLGLTPLAFALAPVTLSGSVPALSSVYAVGVTQVLTYTVTNHVPGRPLPCLRVTLTPNLPSIVRIPVANDCGSSLPPGPSSCNIGIAITPTPDELGSLISETLNVSYGGRCALKSLISFTVRQAFAFIANRDNNSYSVCPRNPDGLLQVCVQYTDPTFNNPSDIIVSSDLQKAWVMNNGPGGLFPYSVSLCPINIETGQLLGGCTQIMDSTFAFGFSGLHPNHRFMYLSNFDNNTVSICKINADGSFSNCIASNGDGTFSQPNGRIAFTNDGTRAYVPNYGGGNGNISICTVDAGTGLFSNCVISSDPTFHGPGGVALNASEKNIYVTNLNIGPPSTVSICPINPNGSLAPCQNPASDGNGTFNFTFNGDAAIANLFVTSQEGYIPNQNTNTISICPLNPNGTFGTCTNTSPGPYDRPESVWVN